MKQVRYAVKYESVNVTDAEFNLVHMLYNLREPMKVTAIKFIRSQYGLGLRESKEICDAIGAEGNQS